MYLYIFDVKVFYSLQKKNHTHMKAMREPQCVLSTWSAVLYFSALIFLLCFFYLVPCHFRVDSWVRGAVSAYKTNFLLWFTFYLCVGIVLIHTVASRRILFPEVSFLLFRVIRMVTVEFVPGIMSKNDPMQPLK